MKRMNNKQKGFTIIELVVVILLLGILTATALPRFMDVTDEAHEAVVDGITAGLNTGSALFHAQWIATGEPSTVTEFDSMQANSAGYIIGSSTVSLKLNQDCLDIYETLIQVGGRPTIEAALATGPLIAADVSVSASDFIAAVTSGECHYAYTGQYTAASAGDIYILEYDASTGAVTRGTSL